MKATTQKPTLGGGGRVGESDRMGGDVHVVGTSDLECMNTSSVVDGDVRRGRRDWQQRKNDEKIANASSSGQRQLLQR